MKRNAALFLAALLSVSLLSGCGKKPQTDNTASAKGDTLVVGTSNFDGKFSPFFYTNAYEGDVLSLVHLDLLGTDREGAVVTSGIDGEVRPYNGTEYTYTGIADCAITENEDGTVCYDITLKEGVKFSDGTVMDIDDVIFSLYVTLDPAYDGTQTVYSLPILGLADYREGEASAVSGIQRLSDNQLRVMMTEFSATAIYTLAGVPVAPLHYYGDDARYDFAQNMFGFPKGDLSRVKSVTTKPVGAGPYKFVSYSGGIVTLEANALYWKGEPKTRYIQFKEGQDADKVSGVAAGTIDITDPSYSTETAKAIAQANGGEVSGDVITTVMVPNLGYGYVGINAKNVNVGEPGSDASKNLRKALATVIAVYRNVAVDSYYGAFANVIHYPISDTSWAAPRPTDPGYREAFSLDVEGQPIYTADMTDQQRYDAAQKAALAYFAAAGYTVENGKVTAAPAGASMSYEVLVSAGGTGDHPTFMALTMAAASLKQIGFDLVVTDVSNFSELTNAVNAGTAELFSMAWTASADPDMYQIYHSQGGSNDKSYSLKDGELDELIQLARKSSDQAYRKTLYAACLDIIADWAVEIPVYQRLNTVIFSSKRVDMSTVTPDMTTFWGWENDIEKLKMR